MQFADEQSASRIKLNDGTVITKCDQCRNDYAERSQRIHEDISPPCDTCRVIIKEENEDAATVYMICRNQYITAGSDNKIMDISIPAVKMTMDMHGIKNQKECFEKVMRTFHHFLSKKEPHESGALES